MTKQEKRRKLSLGVLFWIAIILLILVVFLFNRKNIEQVVESTGLVEVINQRIGIDNKNGGGEPIDAPSDEDKIPEEGNETADIPDNSIREEKPVRKQKPEEREVNDTFSSEEEKPRKNPAESSPDQHSDAPVISSETTNNSAGSNASKSNSANNNESAEKQREYFIHLAYLDENGNADVRAVKRQIRFVSSPLTHTLKGLLAERPTEGNYQNLIPQGSTLNRVWIKANTAYLDFSEAFRFNPKGTVGQHLQLEQVVKTATQFPSVDSVQILIDGKQLEFLGGDGTYIGAPLKAADF